MSSLRSVVLCGSAFVWLSLLTALAREAAGEAAMPPPSGRAFDARVAPVLARHCLECHNGSNKQGGLDLTRAQAVRTGGNRGSTLVPGKPEASWLWKRVAADEMPPKKPLSPAEKRAVKEWIAGGAVWGTDPIDPFRYSSERRAGYDWWSLQPVRSPQPPSVKWKDWPRNPIDRFVLARLEAAGLKPSPSADPRTLIRRVTFDLTGLPPTPEDVEGFVREYEAWGRSGGSDHGPRTTDHGVLSRSRRRVNGTDHGPSALKGTRTDHRSRTAAGVELNASSRQPAAVGTTGPSSPRGPSSERGTIHPYDALVERLLNSPQYGERWARHWLDVVRFAESQGFERNKLRPNAWKYRDWVVEALNADLRYDEFVRLQLAGDVLRPDDPLAVIASGFLVLGPYDLTSYTDGTAMMRAAAREEELEGLVGTVTQTFLGLTGNCARCHDHKFDPIPQKEYYQLAAALGGTYHGAERESLSPTGRARAEQERKEVTDRLALLKQRLPAPDTALTSEGRLERQRLAAEMGRLENRLRLLAGGPAHVSVPKDPGVFHVLARGDFREKRDPVVPAGIAALVGLSPEWGLKGDAPEGERRKALAAWITDPQNPLTARVLVNRVWSHHFGAGLVSTPNDFGFNGGTPSHPELLDYLASWFVSGDVVSGRVGARESGRGKVQAITHSPIPPLSHSSPVDGTWSLKRLHRLIVTSATYRQASRPVPAGMKRDAENRLLWRQNPRRLDAEAFRDAALAISGELDPTLGGPGFRDWTVKSQGNNEIYTVHDGVGPEFRRRSLYRMVVRAGTSPLLDVLDCPDPSVAVARRTVTTTPIQALALLNNAFVEHQAARWAARLEREVPGDRRGQVAHAYRLAFGREADAADLRSGESFAATHGLDQLCLVLLNSNEFLYVD